MPFEIVDAKREKLPLLIGLVGPSGSGKTYSALRLATGIGGPIVVIDTEARRSTQYAKEFEFKNIHLEAPFSSMRYLEAIEAALKWGAKTVIVDSMSHEHEGPGGVLEQHAEEVKRLAGDDQDKKERVNMLAWSAPKQARRQLINRLLQVGANVIFCFRAKEKQKMIGTKMVTIGLMPIGGEEFIYEFTANFLLGAGCKGMPTYAPTLEAEKAVVKLSHAFASIEGQRLTEDVGKMFARWANGDDINPTSDEVRERILALLPQVKDPAKKAAIEKTMTTEDVHILLKTERRMKEITG